MEDMWRRSTSDSDMWGFNDDSVDKECSCDPYSPTSDCCESCCSPFFSVFLVLEALVLIVLVVFYIMVECLAQKKSKLWRLIFTAGIVSCTAKVVRLGLLANPATRHKSDIALFFFLNTHQCFGVIGFLSLVFFWARLRHDLVANKGIYGKLLPLYVSIVIIVIIVYYVQIPLDAAFGSDGMLLNSFKIISGVVVFISVVAYVTYALLLWKSILQRRSTEHAMFFRIFVSAFVTAIFFIVTCLVLFITRAFPSNTVHDYLIRHSIYEISYFAQISALPSGFIFHFIKAKTLKTKHSPARSFDKHHHPMEAINLRASRDTQTNTV